MERAGLKKVKQAAVLVQGFISLMVTTVLHQCHVTYKSNLARSDRPGSISASARSRS